MTRNSSRKKKTRAAAASQGVSYTRALRAAETGPIPPEEQAPPRLDFGTFVAEDEPTQSEATWVPSREHSRVVIDGIGGETLLPEIAVVQAAHNAGLPVLAIGPYLEDYREAAPAAQVFGIGNEGMGGGYQEAPHAAEALDAFINARRDWRLLLVHLQHPLEDQGGQKVWERGFDELQKLTAPEWRAVRRLNGLIGDACTPALRIPGLLVAGVITDDLNDTLLYQPAAFTTRLSAALRLDYLNKPHFPARLPWIDDYLPGWRAVIKRLDDRASLEVETGSTEPFWSGMNPKDGRVVMGSINGGETHAILLPDPPGPEPHWWSVTRESLLEEDRRNHVLRVTGEGKGLQGDS